MCLYSFRDGAAAGLQWGMRRPTTLPLHILAPHGYWHAIVCISLITCSGLGNHVSKDPVQSFLFQTAITLGMLWWGFGVPGTLLCVFIFTFAEACAVSILASSELSSSQLVWHSPVRRPARTAMQMVKRCLREILQGKFLP